MEKRSDESLPPFEAIDRLVKISEKIELAAGEEFIREGDFDESIYLIESGQVAVERGQERVGTIDAGDVVGEMAFIDRRPRSATVRTVTPSVLHRVEREDLLRELGQDPGLLLEFVQAVEQRRVAHLDSSVDQGLEAFLYKVTEEGTSHRAVHHPYLLALRDRTFPDMKWARIFLSLSSLPDDGDRPARTARTSLSLDGKSHRGGGNL